MGTRNNPSPGGLRPGLETTTKRTRTRKEPVRASKLATVANASDVAEEVATRTEPTQESIKNPYPTDPHASVSRPEDEQTLTPSVEIADARPVAPLSTRRHNTRSTSRSVSPSLLNSEFIDRSEDSKPKGKGRARSTSASSTHQVIAANNTRGAKRGRAASENRDDVDEKTTKRAKAKHNDPSDRSQPVTRKRDIRNKIPGSPIPEVPEEEDIIDNKVIKRSRNLQKLPQEEHTFSYAHILATYPQSTQKSPQHAEEQTHQAEPSSSRTPQSTSFNPSTSTPAPAKAEYSQRSDAKSKPIEIAEQRAVHGTPTSSTPQQPVIERTDAQSNERRSDARDVVQQQSTLRNRSASTPPLPTLKHPQSSTRATAAFNGSPILRQGLVDTPVAQGSARNGAVQLASDSVTRKAYLQERYGKPRSRVRHPTTKAILTLKPMDIFEDSEHEDDSENEESSKTFSTSEGLRGWKSDLHVARSAYERVLRGKRLPEPDSSSNGMGPRITRRKPGETPPASRQHEVIEAVKFTQSGNSVEAIDFFKASKSKPINRVRSAAPSPASQRANSQPPSMRSLRQNPVEPREASGRARSASLSPSGDEAAVHHSESNQATEDDESLASVDDYEEKNDNMSESEVDAKEATPILPTTPSSTPSQQASEPRAWSSVLTTVKNAVYTPFKFFGRTPTATETATTNVKEPEFTFSHPHKPAQPLTTPTRSSKQRAKPQSERRSTATNKRRVSNPARIPQTERQRRHVDRSTPLHLRGVSSTRDMQDLHAQQASTRQRQREKEMTSLEENELSHGKTFRAPSPSSESESDDDGDVTTTMADNDEDEPISPPRKTEWRFLPQTIQPARKVRFEAQSTSDARHEQKIWSPTKPLTLSASLKFPTPEEIAAASVPGKSSRLYWQRDEIEMANPAVRNACWKEPVPSKEDNCPFYYVKDQTRRMPYFRKLHKDDTEFKCYNMFGEEAYWFRFPLSGYFVELNHNQEPFLRGQHSMTRWRELMKNPEHLKKEKKALLWKWAQVPEWRKPLLLPEIRPFYKQLMEIGEFAPAGSSSTSAATSSGMNSTANPSGTYKFPEDDESDEEGDHVETDNADQAQFQTPPPKPRPGNAQLPQPQPQPTPARAALAAALANANKHRPSAPSNLRNVTQMSPLQQPDQENRENTIENGGNGTIAKETRPIMTPGKETTSKVPIKAPDAWLKEAEEANMTPEEQSRQLQQVMKDLMNIPDEDIPNIILPKAPKLQLPFGEDVDYVAMNAATKAAFEMNKENHGGL